MGGELSPMGTGNRRCSSFSLFSLLLILVGSAPAPVVRVRETQLGKKEQGEESGEALRYSCSSNLFKNGKGMLAL